MIVDTKYYLGGSDTTSGGAETYYAWERETEVYSGNSTSWIGKIALMYPSDYSYTYAYGVDDVCFTAGYNCRVANGGTPTNSWIYNTNGNLYQWLLSPSSSDLSRLFYIGDSGYVSNTRYSSDYALGVRPVAYLKSNVKITSGDGSKQNPYQLTYEWTVLNKHI